MDAPNTDTVLERSAYRGVADELQGNILRSHGRDRSCHVFVKFADAVAGRAFVQAVLPLITTATAQQEQATAYRAKQVHESHGSSFVGLSLSHAGYVALEFPPPRSFGVFAEGMRKLGPKPDEADRRAAEADWWKSFADVGWDDDFTHHPLHAVLVLADDDADALGLLEQRIKDLLDQTGNDSRATFRRPGEWPRGERKEHFGYVDGISNVDLLTQSREEKTWSPVYPEGQLLMHDPGGERHDGADDQPVSRGSFLVICMLEQDVDGFHRDRQKSGADPLRWVGRNPDGVSPISPSDLNDFDYRADFDGSTCPVNSHVRKVNPRLRGHRDTQFARRGIPYGPVQGAKDTGQDTSRGLLFAGYCRNLDGQFLRMAQRWIPGGFPNKGSEQDALLSRYVTMRGGEYFFTPSMPTLRNIGETTS